jgi:hypothetical protein
MRTGATLFTMTYYGSQMVVEDYNIMELPRPPLRVPFVTLLPNLAQRAFAFMPYRLGHWRHGRPLESPSLIGCSTRPRQWLLREALSAAMR